MKLIKHFTQFFIISILFIIFKIIGLNLASQLSGKIVSLIGPFFRSKNIIRSNILKALPNLDENDVKRISKKMWNNYGKILAEYIFIKDFRSSKFKKNILIEGQEILDEIKRNNEPVIFVSGHFNNFELMAMQIEQSGISLAAIYRPLNNKFLNFMMEKIRKKYICKEQIKKGIAGTRQLLSYFKKDFSIALMVDQRVSQGPRLDFFKQGAHTTTIPAQFVKKFNCKIVPIYIERINGVNFRLTINEPISYSNDQSTEDITFALNRIIEKMIIKNPDQWIWSHNRWK